MSTGPQPPAGNDDPVIDDQPVSGAEQQERARAEPVAVAADESGLRLDRWFRRHYPAVTHGTLERLLRTGQVRIDGRRAGAGDRLEPGQRVRVPPSIQAAPPGRRPASAKRSRMACATM